MTTYAYLRVSTKDKGQTTDNQRMAIDKMFKVDEYVSEDGVSGTKKAFERPMFKAMMAAAKEGDTVICTLVDRLGRNTADILHTVEEFRRLKISLRIMQLDGIDLTSSMGKLVLTVMAACAELERNNIAERTTLGIARTKAAGTSLGRQFSIPPEVLKSVLEEREEGESVDTLVEKYGIPRNTLYRVIKEWGGRFVEYADAYHKRQAQHLSKDFV